MKKKILITLLAVAVLIGTFFIGNKIGASTSWTNEVVAKANKDIAAVGYHKKNELIATDVTGQMRILFEPKIIEEQEELARLLEEYYQLKLAGLTDTTQFESVELQIDNITNDIFERYKKELDTAFENL